MGSNATTEEDNIRNMKQDLLTLKKYLDTQDLILNANNISSEWKHKNSIIKQTYHIQFLGLQLIAPGIKYMS